jgi:hypothetical protein
MSMGAKVAITANAEVVTASEMAVMKTLNDIDLRGHWEIARVRILIERLAGQGFDIVRR